MMPHYKAPSFLNENKSQIYLNMLKCRWREGVNGSFLLWLLTRQRFSSSFSSLELPLETLNLMLLADFD